jgi:hypothetical protein
VNEPVDYVGIDLLGFKNDMPRSKISEEKNMPKRSKILKRNLKLYSLILV